ncbi:hypothetical protein D9M70_469850 [compost metagenome]
MVDSRIALRSREEPLRPTRTQEVCQVDIGVSHTAIDVRLDLICILTNIFKSKECVSTWVHLRCIGGDAVFSTVLAHQFFPGAINNLEITRC